MEILVVGDLLDVMLFYILSLSTDGLNSVLILKEIARVRQSRFP